MSFLYGFGLALAFVGLLTLGAAAWGLFRVVAALGSENDSLALRLKAIESTPAPALLTPDDVRRIVLEIPARPGPEAVPLDMLPRDQMPDRVAVDTFKHATQAPRTMSARVASFEARRRKEAADIKAKPQGGPGASE
jgi:hypothetical protein